MYSMVYIKNPWQLQAELKKYHFRLFIDNFKLTPGKSCVPNIFGVNILLCYEMIYTYIHWKTVLVSLEHCENGISIDLVS